MVLGNDPFQPVSLRIAPKSPSIFRCRPPPCVLGFPRRMFRPLHTPDLPQFRALPSLPSSGLYLPQFQRMSAATPVRRLALSHRRGGRHCQRQQWRWLGCVDRPGRQILRRRAAAKAVPRWARQEARAVQAVSPGCVASAVGGGGHSGGRMRQQGTKPQQLKEPLWGRMRQQGVPSAASVARVHQVAGRQEVDEKCHWDHYVQRDRDKGWIVMQGNPRPKSRHSCHPARPPITLDRAHMPLISMLAYAWPRASTSTSTWGERCEGECLRMLLCPGYVWKMTASVISLYGCAICGP